MSLSFSQLAIDDFSGGITDYILDAKPNQAEEMDNFLIDPNKKAITSPGSQIFDDDMYQIPDGNQRIGGIFASQHPELFINSGRKMWVPNTSAFLELIGPTSNPAFSVGAVTDFPAFAEWNEHVFSTSSGFASPIKFYKDGSNVWQTRTAGMPDLATSPTVTPAAGAASYVYAFLYHYTYLVGTTQFEDFGPVTYVTATAAATPVAITNIPVLANGGTLNYDTTAVKVYIYRSKNGGNVLYKVGEVTNGTTVFNDNTSDTTLPSGLQLYTNSGVLDNDPPPLCKYVTMVNGVAYYGHTKSGTQIFKNRVRQSVQDDPDSCPNENYVDVLDEITGLSSYNDNPLVFTKNHVYRLNGQYNELGQGQVTYEDITKTIGCVSHNSIVQTRYGVFWAGNDGFYWTDGFNFKKISDSINERYKDLVSTTTRASRIVGTYDTKDNRVYWAVGLDTSSTDNDGFIVLDLRWGIRDASTFTTRSNGDDLSPSSVTFFGGQLIRSDRRGYLFKHDAGYATDPNVDTGSTPDLWATSAIIPLYKSGAFNFGLPNVRKWVPRILLTLENQSNSSVQISSVNDNSSKQVDLKEIRYRGNYLWGDPNPVWGSNNIQWSFFNLIEEMRRFPANSLRCSYKQIIITTSITNIYNSDDYGLAVVDGTANTATAAYWPADVQNYQIAFEGDNYDATYTLTRINDTTVSFLDPLDTAPTGSVKWVIKGQPKGEITNILSYVIYFAPLTDQAYKAWRVEQDSDGGNA